MNQRPIAMTSTPEGARRQLSESRSRWARVASRTAGGREYGLLFHANAVMPHANGRPNLLRVELCVLDPIRSLRVHGPSTAPQAGPFVKRGYADAFRLSPLLRCTAP